MYAIFTQFVPPTPSLVAHRRRAGNVLHARARHGDVARQTALHERIAVQVAVACHHQTAESAQARRKVHVVSVQVKRGRRDRTVRAHRYVHAPVRGVRRRIGRIAPLVPDAPVTSGLQRAAVQSKCRTTLVRVRNVEPYDRATRVCRQSQHASLFKGKAGGVIGFGRKPHDMRIDLRIRAKRHVGLAGISAEIQSAGRIREIPVGVRDDSAHALAVFKKVVEIHAGVGRCRQHVATTIQVRRRRVRKASVCLE